jgi:methylated-DNA-[protein]-cysteine S-methyltransferase
MKANTLFLDKFPSPLGTMMALCDTQDRLCALEWVDHEERRQGLMRRQWGAEGAVFHIAPRALPAAIRAALDAYFMGDLTALGSIPVRFAGTPFQRTVWQALRTIPAGYTWSYGELAQNINNPTAMRAVGLANGANPIGIVVPCHRVIGANGRLTGYAGGMARKQWLLEHEGALLKLRPAV